MLFVRFRVIEPDLTDDTSAISYGVMVDEKVWCACGCNGSFEPNEVEVLDSYEPTEDVIAGVMGWPYSQGAAVDYCPTNAIDCPYWKEGSICTIGNPAEECDEYQACMDDDGGWEIDDCDNDCGYDPDLGCFTDDC